MKGVTLRPLAEVSPMGEKGFPGTVGLVRARALAVNPLRSGEGKGGGGGKAFE